MMDSIDIQELLNSMSLTSEEELTTGVNSTALKDRTEKSKNNLVGKFITFKEYSIQNYVVAMQQAWTCGEFET